MTSVSTDRRQGVNSGAAIKVPCRAASTGNLTLSGEQTIDGVACVTGDRVLVKNQTSGSGNGIYIVDTGTWGRSPDWDGAYDVVTGTAVYVTAGTTNAGTYWAVTTTGTITVGTTSVAFTNAAISSAASISFTQAGTGAVTRTDQEKARERISPEDFGCVGDGTTDDSANMALAATAATGKLLKLTPGKTYLLAAVDVPASSNDTVVDMQGAIVKSKVLATNTGSPMFNVTGTGSVIFIGGLMDGQKSSQPADGFSDSFNGGGSGTGRAYRAAIKADATVATGVTRVIVRGTRFKNTYGACVATLDVPRVMVRDCIAETCNFELAFAYYSAGTLLDFDFIDNLIDTPASGHATVNANGAICTNYRRVNVQGNTCYNAERNLIKAEGGRNIVISGNIIDTNTVDNFSGIQVAVTSLLPTSRVLIKNNDLYNVGRGIQVSVSSGQPDTVTIDGNNIYTTTGTTLADGITVDDAKNVIISGNQLVDIKRHGVIISGAASRVKVNGNNLYGQNIDGTQAISVNATTGNWGSVSLQDNHCENFESDAALAGVVVLARSAAFTFAHVTVQGNRILSSASGNRALRASADYLTAGIISDNYIDGQLEHYTAAVETRDNTVTGTVTIPQLTFTPELKFGGAQVGMTTSTKAGFYQRRGNMFFFEARITLTAKGASVGTATLSGWPFVAKNVAGEYAILNLMVQNVTYAAGHPVAFASPNSSSISIGVQTTAAAYADFTDAAFANNSDIVISGAFEIADKA